MPTIKANASVVTQINVFTVKPERQHDLIELLKSAAESVSTVPGWLSASLHRSLDGTRVVNYAQCRDMEAWEAVMTKLRAEGFLERNKSLGEAHPGLYEVVFAISSK
jgi:quinol monooxygenase YgiN